MNKEDVVKLIGSISVSYPNFSNDNNRESLVNLWFEMFKEFPKQIVHSALLEHINKSKFQPTIAEIKEIIFKQCSLIGYEFEELWRKIINAIRLSEIDYGGYYKYPQWNYFPKELKELVSYQDLINLALMDRDKLLYQKAILKREFEKKQEKKLNEFLVSKSPMILIPHWQTKIEMTETKKIGTNQ